MMFTCPQRANILLILLAFFFLFTTVLAAPSSLRGKRYVVNNSNDVVGNDIVKLLPSQQRSTSLAMRW